MFLSGFISLSIPPLLARDFIEMAHQLQLKPNRAFRLLLGSTQISVSCETCPLQVGQCTKGQVIPEPAVNAGHTLGQDVMFSPQLRAGTALAPRQASSFRRGVVDVKQRRFLLELVELISVLLTAYRKCGKWVCDLCTGPRHANTCHVS